jgi:RNA polymerase sigma-70 factor (ECF subfamily)
VSINWPAVVTEFGPAVWRTVYRLLNQHADALDCYQETFLAAWRFAQRQRVDDWTALLLSLATRRAVDCLRRRYRCRLVALDSAPEPTSEADCPLRHAEAGELMDRVRIGLAGLPDKQADVFWLSCVEGLSHQRIADRLQIAPGEVRVLLHRARTRLRAILEPTGQQKGESHE